MVTLDELQKLMNADCKVFNDHIMALLKEGKLSGHSREVVIAIFVTEFQKVFSIDIGES